MKTDITPEQRKQRRTLILLALLFAAPFTLAWLLFNYTQFGRGGASTSHGQLINPPRQLADLALTDPGNAQAAGHLYGKWSLIYLIDGECGRRCEQNLYRLRQIRLAQGKHARRVQRVLLDLGPGHVALTSLQSRNYRGQLLADPVDASDLLARFRLAPGDSPVAAGRTYIVDPRGFLMMSYEADADPAGIIDDLRHLLRYSGVG